MTKNKEVELSPERLKILFQISQRINKISDIKILLDELLHTAITSIGAERGMIILTNERGEEYQTVASESLKGEHNVFSTSIVQAVIKDKKMLLSEDLRTDPRFKDAESIKGLNILSCVCVPLIIPGRDTPLGTLYVDQRIYVRTFTPEDATFIEAFANLAAIAINNAKQVEQLVGENIRLRSEIGKKYEFSGIIGKSEIMQKVFRDMEKVMNDNCTVLITGESGTGKELIARAIHNNGDRKDKPFIAINCGALPETLLEAELFGSMKGAFTGAVDKKGLLQAADGGTVFLDEIPHTSHAMQVKLLRFLQDREVRRVGGIKTIPVDVRLICASNQDLHKAIQDGRFRQDFYYRINVITINIPPLRERRDDIPILAQHFLDKFAKEKKKQFTQFDKNALDSLIHFDWTGNNVRELENEIERAVIFAPDRKTILLDDLSEKIREDTGAGEFVTDSRGAVPTYENFEKQYIKSVLARVKGNKAEAARLMGIPRSTLRSKMRKLGMGK
ncbi:sigma-54-dependent Fis family transcriptional regulator [candidate division WOR-3 bacterium]|nr:sigma-54-dependent Fis family transcriptional regulator [candidate division WOR-3 bacterium]